MNHAIELDLGQIAPGKVRQVISEQIAGDRLEADVRLHGANGQDFVAAHVENLRSLEVLGKLGNYAFAGVDNCECKVDGDVGDYLAHSIRSGVVIVRGHAGHAIGAKGLGGFVAVYGNAGDRTGVALHGADIFIRGNTGGEAGLGMNEGTLIIGGSAGLMLGKGMRGGTIYLRGEAESISPDIEEQRLREPDRLKVGLLLLKAGIKSNAGKDFRVFRSVHNVH